MQVLEPVRVLLQRPDAMLTSTVPMHRRPVSRVLRGVRWRLLRKLQGRILHKRRSLLALRPRRNADAVCCRQLLCSLLERDVFLRAGRSYTLRAVGNLFAQDVSVSEDVCLTSHMACLSVGMVGLQVDRDDDCVSATGFHAGKRHAFSGRSWVFSQSCFTHRLNYDLSSSA